MPAFRLGPQGNPGTDTLDLGPAGPDPRIRPPTNGAAGSDAPEAPDASPPSLATCGRTRSFPSTYEPSPSVPGPRGPMNVGYVHNVVSTNGQWSRGELPDLGYGYYFALRRPRFMREPRTDLGSYNFAKG